MTITTIADILVVLCLVPALYATGRYGLGAAWYTSWLGRIILAQWVSIDAVLGFVAVRRLWGDFPGHVYVAITLYALLLLAFAAKATIIDIEMRSAELVSATKKRDIMTAAHNPAPANTTTDSSGVPTSRPQPKVVAATAGAGVGAAIATVGIYVIETLGSVDLPDTVEGAITVLITAGVAFAAGYIKRPTGIS